MSGKMRKILLKTLALTMLVFIIGFYAGVLFDNLRLEEVKSRLTEIDNLWNDVRLLQSFTQRMIDNKSLDCDILLKENLIAGDKIYEEGQKVEEYEKANRFTPTIFVEKERYALLDLQFWLNSIDLKRVCNASYSTVIYFYSHYNKTTEQGFQDRVLLDLKEKCGPQIIYITFPSDMGIITLNVIRDIYNIEKLPAIMINESIVLYSPTSTGELEKYIKC
jgi:hypothetical protein